MKPDPQPDPTTAYARAVDAGEILAGRLVKLACERHLRDLRDGPNRGLRFDLAAAGKAINFFSYLRHSKGEWAGRPFSLAPWQQFLIGSIFGWKRADGSRRFRIAYNEIARKNGKSTLSAGVGLYLFVADGEPGAEVYSAATKRDQAVIVHSEAVRMVKASEFLKTRIGVTKNNLHILASNSKYEPLGADADTLDGLNIHGAVIDELHAHKSRA
ncbi:MAG: terminase large subunit domain-containing protein, partial [Candidatus Binataceae bacterium]